MNWTLSSLHEGSLEITLTVPLRKRMKKDDINFSCFLYPPYPSAYPVSHFRLHNSSVLYFSLNWAFLGLKHKLHVSTRVRQKVQTRRVVFLFVENRALIHIIILHRSSHLSIYLSIYPTIYLDLSRAIYLSNYLYFYLSIYLDLSICQLFI